MTTSLQFHRMPDGGFCFHKARIASSQAHFSAWFDRHGALLDAESFRYAGSSGCTVWSPQLRAELTELGARFVQVSAAV